MNNSYVLNAGSNFSPELDDDIMSSIFQQYEKVIVESIITSFGLDFLVKDLHGGDVDTIHNVRQIGKDDKMKYKNKKNQEAYENNGSYNTGEYHAGTNYQTIKSNAKNNYLESGQTVEDEYTGNQLHFLGKSKGANPNINAELDHVIAAKWIHDDRGRVLSGLSGKELADATENLKFTNKSLNASMQDMEIPEYIKKHPELPEEVKEKMMKHYNKAKASYEAKIAKAYYTSPKFAKDTALAAGNVGLRMGLRQVFGFIFTEIWFAVKEEFVNVGEKFDLKDFLHSIGNGIKKGVINAKEKYKELMSKFVDGAEAGVLSSLTTTLCNIFFTTAKNVIRLIRQSYASLVQALKVLLINPDNLPFGERMRATTKIIATGASVVIGVIVNEAISKMPIGTLPVLGEIISTFCGTLVTGIMSCTLLYFLDRNETMNKIVKFLNQFHTIEAEVNYFKRQAEYFENYAAQLMNIDINKFREETSVYNMISIEIEKSNNENELNLLLKKAFDLHGIKIPWEGEFDEFMADKNKRLVFE